MSTTGVLLINLGTPQSTSRQDVARYLREFLMDPRVIDIHPIARFFLVKGIIVPFRAGKSREAYQQVWTDEGSPLLTYSQKFTDKVRKKLGDGYQVTLGMRYGSPSIDEAFKQLSNCEKVIIAPLYPQYAASSTGSVIAKVNEVSRKRWDPANTQIIPSFYHENGFIATLSDSIRRQLAGKNWQHLLFSYHGLPERHLVKSGCEKPCENTRCGDAPADVRNHCYGYQCFATTQSCAKTLGLEKDQFSYSFQSRLGRTPWIKPYTDEWVERLLQQGVRDLAVVCPSFVADCLETLEEINLRLREQWQELGGGEFHFVRCLNDDDPWCQEFTQLIQRYG